MDILSQLFQKKQGDTKALSECRPIIKGSQTWDVSRNFMKQEINNKSLELTITFKDRFLFQDHTLSFQKDLYDIRRQMIKYFIKQRYKVHLVLDIGDRGGRPHFHGIINMRDNKESYIVNRRLTNYFGRTNVRCIKDTNKYVEYMYKIYDKEQPHYREDIEWEKHKCDINTFFLTGEHLI